MHYVSSLKHNVHMRGYLRPHAINLSLSHWLLCGFSMLWLGRSMRRGDSDEGWRSRDYSQPQAFPPLLWPSSSLECSRCPSHWCSLTIWPRFPQSNQDPLLPDSGFKQGAHAGADSSPLFPEEVWNSYLPRSEWRIYSFLIVSKSCQFVLMIFQDILWFNVNGLFYYSIIPFSSRTKPSLWQEFIQQLWCAIDHIKHKDEFEVICTIA